MGRAVHEERRTLTFTESNSAGRDHGHSYDTVDQVLLEFVSAGAAF